MAKKKTVAKKPVRKPATKKRASKKVARTTTKKAASKKRAAKKAATEKATSRRSNRTGSGFDDPKPAGGKLKEAFPLDVCKRLVGLVDSKHRDKQKLSELKAERKDLRAEIRADQEEIETVVNDEEAEGRGLKGKAFSTEASTKIRNLQRDVNRRAKKVGTLDQSIADLRDKIRDAQNECDKTISSQDPEGTLWGDAPQSSKDGE
tara:strand:+ start:11708 stop:12322 length:615 start_codon:yes stop_codon:yes gene_type:complete